MGLHQEIVDVRPGGNDGWQIHTITTYVIAGGSKQELTADSGIDHW